MTGHSGTPGLGRRRRFADVLDAALTARGWSLTRLSQELAARGHRVSRATLGYWRSGRSEPERGDALRALPDLEELLEQPVGTLRMALGSRRVRGRQAAREQSARDLAWPMYRQGAGQEAMLAELGVHVLADLERTEISHLVTFDGPTRRCRWKTRTHWQARADGVAAFPIVYQTQSDPGELRVEGVTGCALGRMLYAPDERLTVCAGSFPAPLALGERIMTEYVLRLDDEHVMTRALATNAYCTGPFTLTVRFVGADPPKDIVTFDRELDRGEIRDLTPATPFDGYLSRTIIGAPVRIGFAWDLDRYPLD